MEIKINIPDQKKDDLTRSIITNLTRRLKSLETSVKKKPQIIKLKAPKPKIIKQVVRIEKRIPNKISLTGIQSQIRSIKKVINQIPNLPPNFNSRLSSLEKNLKKKDFLTDSVEHNLQRILNLIKMQKVSVPATPRAKRVIRRKKTQDPLEGAINRLFPDSRKPNITPGLIPLPS